MRAIWKGAITFGMVTIPVKLYTATEQKDVRLRMLCKKHEAPIQEKRVCSEGGEELAWDELARGYEVKKDEFVVLETEEIDAAKPESSTTIDIGDFVEAAEIDPVYFEKSYFLEPTEVGAKAFSLLNRALEETERVALARVTIRTRERLATMRPTTGHSSWRRCSGPTRSARPARSTSGGRGGDGAAKELQMARSLVESLADKFRPESYTDAYREALEELIDQKMRGETRAAKRRKPEPKVIDLMEALKASVDDAKKAGPARKQTRSSRPKRSRTGTQATRVH